MNGSTHGRIALFQLGVGAAVLALIYAMVLSSFALADLITGFCLGVAVLVGFRRFVWSDLPERPRTVLRRAIGFGPFALAVMWEVIAGTWTVASTVLGMRPLVMPGIVSVPIGERSPLGVAVSGLATTLSPGSLLVDVDWEAGVMLIHVIDASNPDAVRASLHRFYDRYQRHVFP